MPGKELLTDPQGEPGDQPNEDQPNDTGQDDVSRIIGQVTVTVLKRRWIIGPLNWKNWSVIQSMILDGKRKRMKEALIAIKGDLGTGEYREAQRQYLRESGNTASLQGEDAGELIGTPEGMGTIVWVMIESAYKADSERPTFEDCIDAFIADTLFTSEADQETLARQMFACMGLNYDQLVKSDDDEDDETGGNESGQTQA